MASADENTQLRFPVLNPFPTTPAAAVAARQQLIDNNEGIFAGMMNLISAVRSGLVPEDKLPPTLRFALFGTKTPELVRQVGRPRQARASAESTIIRENLLPVFHHLLEFAREGTTHMPFEPLVMNGWETYCDPERHAREVAALGESFLIACTAADVGASGDYYVTSVNRMSVLVVRGHDGSSA